jgi:hypothetical protein
MLKHFMQRFAMLGAILGMLIVGALGVAGDASASAQRIVMSGTFRTQNCLFLAGLWIADHGRGSAWCSDVGLPPGWSRLWRVMS